MIPHGTESNLNRGTTSQKVPGYVVEHLAVDSALMPYAVAGGNGLRHEAADSFSRLISFGRFPSEPTCPGSETSLVTPVYRKVRHAQLAKPVSPPAETATLPRPRTVVADVRYSAA